MEQRQYPPPPPPPLPLLPPPSQSALSLLNSFQPLPRASSGCSSIDSLLTPASYSSSSSSSGSGSIGLGLTQGSVLELTGPPGIGKTRTILGFVLNFRFNSLVHLEDEEEEGSESEGIRRGGIRRGGGGGAGEGGQVLVVDAEGSLSPSMIESTASLFASHNSLPPESVTKVCSGIHYTVINELSDLVAFFHTLPHWLIERPLVKLVVIDSLSFHFRPSQVDLHTKQMITNLILSTLTQLISPLYSVSVILSTQMTIKLFNQFGEPTSFISSNHSNDKNNKVVEGLLIPGLGDTWLPPSPSSSLTTSRGGVGGRYRICLYYDEKGGRHAHLIEGNEDEPRKTRYGGKFLMDALGPCDVPVLVPVPVPEEEAEEELE